MSCISVFYFWYLGRLELASVVMTTSLLFGLMMEVNNIGFFAGEFSQAYGQVKDGLELVFQHRSYHSGWTGKAVTNADEENDAYTDKKTDKHTHSHKEGDTYADKEGNTYTNEEADKYSSSDKHA